MGCTEVIHRASLEEFGNRGFRCCLVRVISVGLSAGLLRVVGWPGKFADK